jgi:hypothetical protein
VKVRVEWLTWLRYPFCGLPVISCLSVSGDMYIESDQSLWFVCVKADGSERLFATAGRVQAVGWKGGVGISGVKR